MPQLTQAARTPISQFAQADLDTNMNSYSFCGYTLDPSQHLLTRGEEPVDLTPRALDILLLLVANAGKTVSKETILEKVWAGNFVEESNITVQMSSLRNMLADTGISDLIRTVHGKGYCFTAPVTVTPTPGIVVTEENATQFPEEKSIVVLPVRNESGDEELDYIAEALTDCLTNGITRVKGLRVVPRDAAVRHADYNGRLPQIASELRVGHALIGRMRTVDSDIAVSFELIDVAKEDQMWGEQLRLDGSDLLELQRTATERISDLVISELGLSRSAFTFTSTTRSPESHRLYLKGKYLFDQRTAEQTKAAIISFRHSIKADPTNLASYIALAEAYRLLFALDQIGFQEALNSIEEIIPVLADVATTSDQVLALLGGVKMYFNWDFEEAERLLKRAIRLNPMNLDARYKYSDVLIARGNFSEALKELSKILDFDPASPTTLKRLGKALYRMGHFSSASIYLEEVLEMNRNDFEALAVAAAIDIELARFDDAKEKLLKSLSIEANVDVESLSGYLLAKQDHRDEAMEWIASFLKKHGECHPVKLARVYAALGNTVQALDCLNRAFSEHEIDLIGLKSDPRWRSLSNNEHFEQLVNKIGLA